MADGWVKLHRKVIDNEIFRSDRTAWHVFETLLVLANKETGKWSGGSYQLASMVGINKPTLYKAILRLEKAGMINREVNTKYTVYYICKWRTYQSSSKQPVNSEETTGNTLTRIKNKEILSKDNMAISQFGKPEINELFEYWEQSTGIRISAKIKQNRNACNNLLKTHGSDKVKALINGVAQAQNDQFAPRIADFVDLQSKLNQLLTWGKKRITTKGTVKI